MIYFGTQWMSFVTNNQLMRKVYRVKALNCLRNCTCTLNKNKVNALEYFRFIFDRRRKSPDFVGSLRILHSSPSPLCRLPRGRRNLRIFDRVSGFLRICVLFHCKLTQCFVITAVIAWLSHLIGKYLLNTAIYATCMGIPISTLILVLP